MLVSPPPEKLAHAPLIWVLAALPDPLLAAGGLKYLTRPVKAKAGDNPPCLERIFSCVHFFAAKLWFNVLSRLVPGIILLLPFGGMPSASVFFFQISVSYDMCSATYSAPTLHDFRQ